MLEFLKSIKFKEPTKQVLNISSKNPTGMTLRLFRDGRIYPSKELVDHFNLEYSLEPGETNGFDIVDSLGWKAYDQSLQRVIFVAPVDKELPKVDIFGTSRSAETTVMTQGPIIEGLWEMVMTAYSLNYQGHERFVDLTVAIDTPITTEDGIYNLPKKVQRGEKKGQTTYIRRENITLYPLIPANVLTSTTVDPATEVAQEDVVSQLNN